MGFAFVTVQRFKVEVELAEVFQLEAANLKFDGHQAVEAAMKEQQVQSEITPSDLQRIFRADKAEIATQLDHVGIAKHFQSCRVRLLQHCRDFCWLGDAALEQCCLELALQFAAGPLFLDRHTQVELALFRVFTLAENDLVMGSGQLSRQCRDFFLGAVNLIELTHAEQIRASKTSGPNDQPTG